MPWPRMKRHFDVVRLEHGKPRYGEDISERYLAQEANQAEALHFHKGCYLGQEIVERAPIPRADSASSESRLKSKDRWLPNPGRS